MSDDGQTDGPHESTVVVSPPAPQVSENKILEMLAGLAQSQEAILGSINTLNERVTKVETATPRTVKAQREPTPNERKAGTYQRPDDLQKRMKLNRGKNGTASGREGLFDTSKGTDRLPPDYQPVFYQNQLVQLNPAACIWGSERHWSEVLADKFQDEPMVGEVLGIQYITKSWEPKYKVHFPGLTAAGGDGFREAELLPVD